MTGLRQNSRFLLISLISNWRKQFTRYNLLLREGYIRTCPVGGEGWTRESDSRGNNELLLRAESSDGELRSAYGKIHGGVPIVQGRRGA